MCIRDSVNTPYKNVDKTLAEGMEGQIKLTTNATLGITNTESSELIRVLKAHVHMKHINKRYFQFA